MSDDHRPDETTAKSATPAPDVTSMSLRAERLRRQFARAAGSKSAAADPGLSPAVRPRDPELNNRYAIVALTAGVVAVFVDFVFVPSVVAFVFCWLALGRSADLRRRGKQPWGRRRAIWAFWFAVFGVAQTLFQLFVGPLFR